MQAVKEATSTESAVPKYKSLLRPAFDPISTVSLFTGAGGMDLGFEVAGFSTRCCVEQDSHCCITLRANRASSVETGFHSFLKVEFIARQYKSGMLH